MTLKKTTCDEDWLFKDEMNAAVKLGGGCAALARMQVGPKRPIASLFTAFSRPGGDKEKCYVQAGHLKEDQRASKDSSSQPMIY